jgi:tRNA (guanine-N7-)-methyltransferase
MVVEIGFGTGASTVAMAEHDRSTALLAIDVHTPGIGDLLDKAGAAQLTNVRVMEADALTVLERMVLPGSLSGVRSYFPDPWPKARHHKRRLVQPPIAQLLNSRLIPGGYWHIATDWDEYAESIKLVMAAESGWVGGQIKRPESRPVTMFEGRALREGRTITDLFYTKA